MAMVTLTAPGDRQHFLPDGSPCPCTPEGGIDLGEWNPTCMDRWNSLRTLLARHYPGMQFLRAVETQSRGALHLHIIMWCPKPVALQWLRKQAVHYGFGHSVDVAECQPGSRRAAYYVSKYVTKSCDDREEVPWVVDRVDRSTGEVLRVHITATHRNWSSSQSWGCTMKELRIAAARARAAAHAARADDPVIGQVPEDVPPAASIGTADPPI